MSEDMEMMDSTEPTVFVGVRLSVGNVQIIDQVAERMAGTRSEAVDLILRVYDRHMEALPNVRPDTILRKRRKCLSIDELEGWAVNHTKTT